MGSSGGPRTWTIMLYRRIACAPSYWLQKGNPVAFEKNRRLDSSRLCATLIESEPLLQNAAALAVTLPHSLFRMATTWFSSHHTASRFRMGTEAWALAVNGFSLVPLDAYLASTLGVSGQQSPLCALPPCASPSSRTVFFVPACQPGRHIRSSSWWCGLTNAVSHSFSTTYFTAAF